MSPARPSFSFEERVEHELKSGELLADVVMEFRGDPEAFLFGDSEDFSFECFLV
jgi:hypothetical protein